MPTLGVVHTAFGILALFFGAAVLLRPKGTRLHRRLGWGYALSMGGLLGTSFMIYRLFGGFGPFHVAAILSLVTTAMGVVVARWRIPRGDWVRAHYYWMTYSYVGLVAATVSEVLTRAPSAPFWGAVLVGSLAVLGAGSWLINRRAERSLRRVSVRAR